MSDGSILIRISGLEKTYVTESERLTIIRGLDLAVESGCKAVITGQSGSGKSTLLNIIGGLDLPSAGAVDVCGFSLSCMGEDDLTRFRRSCVGLIFQFHYLLKDFTALENVFLPAYMAGCPRKEASERAKGLLAEVGLEKRVDHLPSQLSGGERQRVAVARALVNSPDLILADEPTGNLDPANSMRIGELLFSMADRYRKTLVLVTHDRELARGGDVCYDIKEGRLTEIVLK